MRTTSNSSTTTRRAKAIARTDALTVLASNPTAFAEGVEHPGILLRVEFLEPLGVTAYRLAKATGMSQTRVGEILRGERSITADAAVRLGLALGTTAEFWLGLQADFDLRSFLASEGREVAAAVTDLRVDDDAETSPPNPKKSAAGSRR